MTEIITSLFQLDFFSPQKVIKLLFVIALKKFITNDDIRFFSTSPLYTILYF